MFVIGKTFEVNHPLLFFSNIFVPIPKLSVYLYYKINFKKVCKIVNFTGVNLAPKISTFLMDGSLKGKP